MTNPTPAGGLKQKYAGLTKSASDLGLQVSEQGGKLQFTGTTNYQLDKDEFWNQIKTHSGWENEVAADIKVANADVHGKYTVKSGDSLSKIAKHIYGDAGKYQKIFEANRDTLKNPDLIHPGQVLTIPK